MIKMECPECGSSSFTQGKAETFCKDCGIVVEDEILEDKEYRAYTAEEEEKRGRVGGAITYTKPDRGISTKMGNRKELYNMKGSKRGKFSRMRRWHNRIENSRQGKRTGLLQQLRLKISELGLPQNIYEDSARLVTKAQDEDLVKGRRKDNCVAACIYISCKNHEVPRSLKEICELVESDKSRVADTYRYLARELGLQIKPSDPKNFIPRYASELDFGAETQSKARNLIDKGKSKNLFAGKGPKGVVAAALYLACKQVKGKNSATQREIAMTIGVTPVTLRKTKKMMKQELQLEPAMVA